MSHNTHAARLRALVPTALVGLFAGLAAVAGSYAAAGFTPSFVAAPVSGLLARRLPDVVVRYAITLLGSLGQQLNLLTAVALVVVTVASTAAGLLVLGERLGNRALPAVLTGVGVWALTAVLTGRVALALSAAAPAAAVVAVATVLRATDVGGATDRGRREVVGSGLFLLGIGAASYVLGRDRSVGGGTPGGTDSAASSLERDAPTADRRQRLLADADAASFDLSGMDPLVSEEFYRVDINAVDPSVDESAWSLSVTGAVENEVTVDYDELRAMDSVDRFETLRCVGEKLNGHKMDTALWTGVPITDILERAGPESGCECVMLRAEDDYFEEFPMAALTDGLLAYGMNGEALPRAHGYPARALIPGHWGEINVKWISEIEVLEREAEGYWEQRGWHGTGPVNTVAKIHHTSRRGDRAVVGGHAYAGTRGVETVEVSTDGGATWDEATLTEPLEGIDVWRQWRYEYDHPGSRHEVVARATDGEGQLQSREESGPFPSGPSGWVSKTVR